MVCSTAGNPGTGKFQSPVRPPVPAGQNFGRYHSGGVHYGIDYSIDYNVNIFAADTGTVKEVVMGFPNVGYEGNFTPNNGFGNMVSIDHGNGYFSIYGHLMNAPMVTVGQNVTASTIIGKMGSSGNSTGPHLHFQVEDKKAGSPISGFMRYAMAINPTTVMGGSVTGNVDPSKPEEVEFCKPKTTTGGADGSYDGNSSEDELYGGYKNIEATGTTVLDLKVNRNNDLDRKEITREPKITAIDITNRDNVNIYGLGVYKNMNVPVKLEKEEKKPLSCKTYDWLGDCIEPNYEYYLKSGKEYYIPQQYKLNFGIPSISFIKYTDYMVEKLEHSQIRFYLNNFNDSSEIGSLWNDSTTGKYKLSGMKYDKFSGENDKICVKTIVHGKLDEYNEINYQNTEKKGDCYLVKNYIKSTLETPIMVSGDKSLQTRDDKHPNYQDNNYTQLPVNLKFIDDNDRRNYKNQIPSDKKVWIVAHGFNNAFDGDRTTIARNIKSLEPNSIVLGLDWSVPAFGMPIASNSVDVCRAATWIKPIATEVGRRLYGMGAKKPENINIIGHSLGVLMAMQLSDTTYENRVNTIISLEAPSEMGCGGSIFVQAFPPVQIGRLEKRAKQTRSFVGSNSVSGSLGVAEQAHESYIVNFNHGVQGGPSEHSKVVEMFIKMLTDNKFDPNILDPLLNYQNPYFRNKDKTDKYSGYIENYSASPETNYVTNYSGNTQRTFGTEMGNNIPINSPFFDSEIWGSGGNDRFALHSSPKWLPTIKDLANGDRIEIDLKNSAIYYYTITKSGNQNILKDVRGQYSDTIAVFEGSISENDLKADLDRFKRQANTASIFIQKEN